MPKTTIHKKSGGCHYAHVRGRLMQTCTLVNIPTLTLISVLACSLLSGCRACGRSAYFDTQPLISSWAKIP
jgi:hypothetical protein